MPLRTACTSCGKNLQVRDELAGKKVKCPGCQTVFVAAAAAGQTAIETSPARPAPPVPQAKDKVSAKPMAKRPAPPPVDDDEDDEEMEERPARDRGKKRSRQSFGASGMLWVWLSIGAVVVIGGALGAYFLFFSGPAAPVVVAQQKPPEANKPASDVTQTPSGKMNLADLVPGDALLFVSVNLDVLNAKALAPIQNEIKKNEAELRRSLGIPLADMERVSVFSVAGFERLQQPGGPVVTVLQTNKPFDPQQIGAAIKAGDMSKNQDMAFEILTDHTIVAGPQAMMQEFKNKKGQVKATGVLERALTQAAASKGLVAAVIIPPDAAQQASLMLKNAPPQAAAFLNTQSVLASLDLTDRLTVRATLTMSDAASAQQAKKSLDELVLGAPIMLGLFAQDPQMAPLVKAAQQTLQTVAITAQDKDVNIAMQADMNMIAAAMQGLTSKLQGAGASATETNNLKQIVLAWHNYESVNRSFPPQTVGKGLSWRVAILPYLEQDQLYKQFKLDEPWDSPANKSLVQRMPKIYESPTRKVPPGFTFYQTFTGANTINKSPTQGMRMMMIKDGTSNTIMMTEAAQPVEWTKPADIQVAPGQPILLGGPAVSVAYADGSVRRLPPNLDDQMLRWLIDPADGKAIPNLDAAPGKK